MKAAAGLRVRTTIEVRSGFRILAVGTEGTVLMVKDKPHKAYLVDLGSNGNGQSGSGQVGTEEWSAYRPDYAVLYPDEVEPVPNDPV